MIRRTLYIIVAMILAPTMAWSFEIYRDGDTSLDVGFWGQAWYQYVGNYDRDGDKKQDDDIHDFMIRRAYFNVQGTVTPQLSFFVHIAGDRLGQDGLDQPSDGLGSGLALRDGWVCYKLIGDDLMVQVGRMYIPFTRNYGTTSAKSLLTADIDWSQGGIRGGTFYPSRVGRDDGVTVWGNVLKDKLQYRLMIADGVEDKAKNPDDRLRFAGRLSYNFFDPETGWFNNGAYLGKKKILAVGGGFDYQQDLIRTSGAKKMDYSAYTFDVFLDMPIDKFAITAEASYIRVNNTVNSVTWSDLTSGKDGDIVTAKAGVLLAEKIQPFVHVDTIMPDASGTDDTIVYGVGCNYYIKGPANKITAEWTLADDNNKHWVDIVTIQAAFGF